MLAGMKGRPRADPAVLVLVGYGNAAGHHRN